MANVSTLRVAALLLVTASVACTSKSDPSPDGGAKDAATGPATDGGAGVSIACSAPSQDRCKEFPQPSEEQRAALTVECSSVSGVPSSPASCPTAGFVGKCTIAATGKDGPEVRRWYKADDAAYQQDFCVNTAKGVWSTVF